MECEKNFILIKFIRISYIVFVLDNRAMKLCTKPGLILPIVTHKHCTSIFKETYVNQGQFLRIESLIVDLRLES